MNYKKYLYKQAQQKHGDALGIYMTYTYSFYRDSVYWVLDTKFTSHIYNDPLRLTRRRKLRKDMVQLMIKNCARVVVVVLGNVNLKLSSRDCLYLEECHCVPDIVKNIISVSCL